MIDLKDKIALVTGGTRGIGKAIRELLTESGCTVYYTGRDKNLDSDELYLYLDLTIKESVDGFISKLNSIGRLDFLINNAGTNIVNHYQNVLDSEFDEIQQVNLKGPFIISREVSKIMKRNNFGRIINISSIWGVISREGRSSYSVSKHGIIGLTKTLALELCQYGILVNSISPGFTKTELTLSTNNEFEIKQLESKIPIKRMAKSKEIANVVLFLCSELSTYINGQNIIVDGGYSIK